jgi:hypothetical protein
MKKIYIFLFILFLMNKKLNAQIELTGNITTAGATSYATHIDSLGKGGYMSMPTLNNRNNIPVERRKQGMLVYVQATDSLYKLTSSDVSLNTGWVAVGLLSQQKLTDSLNSRLRSTDTLSLSNRIDLKANVGNITDVNNELALKLNIIDTANLLKKSDTSFLLQEKDTASLSNRIDLKASLIELNYVNTSISNKFLSDTTYLLQKRDTSFLLQKMDTASLSNRIDLKASIIELNNINTSISNKFLSDTTYLLQKKDTASISNRINLKLDANKSGVANGVASLNALGKIPTDQIPAISFSSVRIISSEAEMLGLTSAVVGSVAVRTDVNKSFILSANDPTVLSNWIMLLTPAPPVQSVNTYSGHVTLTKTDVGLGNVDNTSDENKPLSKISRDSLNVSFRIRDTSFLLQRKDTNTLSNRINLKLTTTDTSFLLKKTDTSFLLKKTDTSFLLKKTDTSFLLQKVDTTAILAMYAKKFTKDVVVNFGGGSFGKYANGETIPAKGKTLDEFLYDVLTRQIPPTYSAPNVSISASPAFGSYEIGYTPGLVTLSYNYNRNDAGNVTSVVYNKGGTSLGTGVNTNTPGQITNSVSYNVTVNYGAGTTVKNDNLGNPYPTGQITAGSTSSGSGSYSTYSKRYWGGTSVAFTASSTYNYAVLSQALGSDNNGSTNSITLSLTPTGTQNVFFAYLATSPDLISILYNGFENIDAFTKTVVSITNAQGYTQSYKVYTSKEVYSSTLRDIIFK